MAAGGEFRTTSGIIQIDDQAPVLCLRFAGSSTVVNQHPASQFASTNIAMTVDISVTAETPQIYLRGEQAGSAFGVIATTKSGDTWTFRVIGFSHSPRFSYFIFDNPIRADHGAGVEIEDANGRVMFSSLYRPKILKGFTYNDSGGNPPSINQSAALQLASGHNASITRREYDDNLTDGDTITYWTDYLNVASVNGGKVSVNAYAIAGGSTNGGQGSPPIGTGLGGWGSPSSMTAVDVTGLVSVVTPASPIVSVSPSSMTATGTGSGTTTTGMVTATASGGSGSGYQYQWAQTLTDARVVAVGPTNVRTLQTQVIDQVGGTSIITKWQCRVTDSAGNIGFSDEVTMTHVQAGAYTTLNPFTLPDLSFYSNDPSGYSNDGAFIVSGINQPVVLRFSRGNQWDEYNGGGVWTRRLYVYRLPAGSTTWIENFIGAGANNTIDLTVNNGDTILFRVFFDSTAGKGATSFNAWIYNVTTGGNQIGTFAASGIADANNDFNVADYVPDILTLPVIVQETNDPTLNWSMAWVDNPTITGINRPITLRFQCYNYVGNLSALYLDCYVMAPGAGWVFHGQILANVGPAPWLDVPNVVAGSKISFNPTGETHSGRRSATWDMVCWSLEGNSAFAQSIGNSFVVDADDNYNNADYTPDALSFPAQSIVTNDYYGGVSVGRTITGINQTITIRANVSNHSGNISAGGVYFSKNGVTQGTGMLWTSGDDSRSATFVDGDSFSLFIDAQTFSGRKQGQFYTTLTVVETGQILGGFWTYCDVDQNNDYNVADYEPDGFSLPTLTVYTNENIGDSTGQDAKYLTGFNQPITLRLDLVGASGSVSGGVVRLIRYTPSAGWHEAGLIWLPQGGSCSATFLSGDYVYTDVLAVWTDSGRKDMNFTLRLTNETTGTMITQHAVNLTVDADNNHNLDYTPNNISFPSMSGSGTTRPLTIYGSPYTVTGFNAPVLMRTYFALNYHTVQAKAHPGGAEEVGDGATNGAAYCHVYRNGGLVASLQHGFWGDWSGPEQYDIVDAWFSPGDTIQFVLQFDVSNENETAQINGYCSGAVYFDNLTVPGNRVGSFGWTQALNKPFG